MACDGLGVNGASLLAGDTSLFTLLTNISL